MAEGDGSSRNFRSSYYEKLGFCGTDEKNYLDLLIASSPFDLEKLSDLCERFELDRKCIEAWKILLGVECGRTSPFDEFANVRRVRTEHFQSLKHNLEVLLRHNAVIKNRLKSCSKTNAQENRLNNHAQNTVGDQTSKHNHPHDQQLENNLNGSETELEDTVASSRAQRLEQGQFQVKSNRDDTLDHHQRNQERVGSGSEPKNNRQHLESTRDNLLEDIEVNPGRLITLMYLLEAGRLDTSDIYTQLDSEYCRKLSAMSTFFVNVSHDLQEAFFLFRNFTNNILNKP